VGKVTGPRDCAPGDVPTIVTRLKRVGTAQAHAFAHPTQLFLRRVEAEETAEKVARNYNVSRSTISRLQGSDRAA
jgi:hypothetical protein